MYAQIAKSTVLPAVYQYTITSQNIS